GKFGRTVLAVTKNGNLKISLTLQRLNHTEHSPKISLRSTFMIPRETLKRLAGIYSKQGTAISFYFKPQTPQNKAHQAEPILIKDKVRKLLGSISGIQRNRAGDDLQRILKISGELRVSPRPKAIFACKEHDLWIDLDIDAAPETRLSMSKHFQLAPLLAGSQDEPRCCIV